MEAGTRVHRALHWDGSRLAVLDQTRLPAEEVWLQLAGARDTAHAIRRLAVRGAPLIGIAAAYGLAMEVSANPGSLTALQEGAETLRAASPTPVSLAHAVDRVRDAVLAGGPTRMGGSARAAAEALHAHEEAASTLIAEAGADLLDGARRIATICNCGALAGGGEGSALAVILALHVRAPVRVLVCETRPLLNGARLTAWELDRRGVPYAVCVDAAAASLLRAGEADAVLVGGDRIAGNGDVASHVGTYALALAADAAGVPFVVASPATTIALTIPDGDAIEVEERDADEVRRFGDALATPPGAPVRNPAFDVTPARLVTALVTEHGVAAPVDAESVRRVAGAPGVTASG
jgi:methylthioribose-1-phosphate isomerase